MSSLHSPLAAYSLPCLFAFGIKSSKLTETKWKVQNVSTSGIFFIEKENRGRRTEGILLPSRPVLLPVPLIDPGEGVGEEEGEGISIIALFEGCEAQILSHMSMIGPCQWAERNEWSRESWSHGVTFSECRKPHSLPPADSGHCPTFTTCQPESRKSGTGSYGRALVGIAARRDCWRHSWELCESLFPTDTLSNQLQPQWSGSAGAAGGCWVEAL